MDTVPQAVSLSRHIKKMTSKHQCRVFTRVSFIVKMRDRGNSDAFDGYLDAVEQREVADKGAQRLSVRKDMVIICLLAK